MRNLVFKILRFSGLPFVFRNTVQKNRVSIFMFHDMDTVAAEKCFSFFKKKYNVIGLDTLIDAHDKNDGSSIPKKAAIITFDDGHIDNYKLLPILKKLNLPITIFLCSEIVGTNRHFWFKHKNLKEDEIQELKKLKTNKRLKELKDMGFANDKEFKTPQALQREQIAEMKPYVNFQSHTRYHPILTKSIESDSEFSISRSKTDLEKKFKLNINAFAYPNGDYGNREVQYVKDAGYRCAVTVDPGFNTIRSDMFRLKRISLSDSGNMDEIIVKSSGVWSFIKKITN